MIKADENYTGGCYDKVKQNVFRPYTYIPDAVCTACIADLVRRAFDLSFCNGIDKAKKLWNERKDFDFIAVTDSGEIYITRGIEKDFELSQDYNELNVSVIKSEQNQ